MNPDRLTLVLNGKGSREDRTMKCILVLLVYSPGDSLLRAQQKQEPRHSWGWPRKEVSHSSLAIIRIFEWSGPTQTSPSAIWFYIN